jgi:glycosyltransferase involved in cell wall biosynthesis
MTATRISFVIPMYNEAATIGRSLAAIQAESVPGDEVIVIDNGSTDGSPDIARRFPGIIVLSLPGATIAALRNHGAALAKGLILGFIDADCVITPGWRAKVIDILGRDEIAGVGSRYSLPADAVWIERAWFSQTFRERRRAHYINSGNLAVRKSVFNKVGGFDESLVTGEDAEFGLRLNSLGFTLVEEPEVQAAHLGNPKTLSAFYRKQKWHGLGMFGSFRIARFDRPVVMTFLFAASLAAALIPLPWLTLRGQVRFLPWVSLLLLWVPSMTALFRLWQFKNFRYFPHLVYLYFLYYLARVHSLGSLLVNRRIARGFASSSRKS